MSVVAFALAGFAAIVSWLGVVVPALAVSRARTWVATPVTRVEWQPDVFGVTRGNLVYHYSNGAWSRTGERYAFRDPRRFLSARALDALPHLRAASDCTPDDACRAEAVVRVCYVDPADPDAAVLVRDLPLSAYDWRGPPWLLVGLLLGALARHAERSERTARILRTVARIWTPVVLLALAAWLAVLGAGKDRLPAVVAAVACVLLATVAALRARPALALVAWLAAFAALVSPIVGLATAPFGADEPAPVLESVAGALCISCIALATSWMARATIAVGASRGTTGA